MSRGKNVFIRRDLSGGNARAPFCFSFNVITAPKVAPGKMNKHVSFGDVFHFKKRNCSQCVAFGNAVLALYPKSFAACSTVNLVQRLFGKDGKTFATFAVASILCVLAMLFKNCGISVAKK